jgi:hypothetical protein
MATQELEGNPCNIGTKNWRQPDQWPISNMMLIKLKIRMNTPTEFKNCSYNLTDFLFLFLAASTDTVVGWT